MKNFLKYTLATIVGIMIVHVILFFIFIGFIGAIASFSEKTVTVKNNTGSEVVDTYDNSKIYTKGDTVIYNGKKYVCKWWVVGEAPDTSDAWEEVV